VKSVAEAASAKPTLSVGTVRQVQALEADLSAG